MADQAWYLSPRRADAVLPRPGYDGRVVKLLDVLRRSGVDWMVRLPSGETFDVEQDRKPGEPEPAKFALALRTRRLLRGPITQLRLGRAFVAGDVDVEVLKGDAADVFGVREGVHDGMSLGQAAQLALGVAFAPPTWANLRAIRRDYRLPDAFFHTFLDTRYRLYSQGRFASEGESIEDAAHNKLANVARELDLKTGDHVLDIGAGWGGFMEYCGRRGVKVTSLTIDQKSADYVRHNIAEPAGGMVLEQDFLDHRARGAYDHVAILGVIEHIPAYRRFVKRVWEVLKPDGRLYLDASATREKYAGSAFTRRFTWTGPHSCLALQDIIRELAYQGFEILKVENNARHYELTMRGWADQLERQHDYVAANWGESAYREFRVFLWGGAHGFKSGRLQAYTLVAERPNDAGRRTSLLRRAAHVAALVR
jgi:cyclopropane-fatty-acyl-phospholipid synthase